jgi:thymidylate synthase (FAD)
MEASYIGHCGSDTTIVNAARVSFGKEIDTLRSEDERLISYLAEHDHRSPFHHTFITLRCKAPIFVARQLQKHEYMPWNEISRRYVDSPPEFYHPEVWRGRATSNKQGSKGVVWVPEKGHTDNCLKEYGRLLDAGVAPEMARIVLPVSMYTEWYWSGTLTAWQKMYALRTKEDAQAESRTIANACGEIIEPLFPVSWKALNG